MTVTLHSWLIPTTITLIFAAVMCRPIRDAGWTAAITPLLRALWLLPIAVTWIVYLSIMLALK